MPAINYAIASGLLLAFFIGLVAFPFGAALYIIGAFH